LENIIERVMILEDSSRLTPASLRLEVGQERAESSFNL
jgi:hypothetical protein